MSQHLSQHKTIPLSQGQYALVDEQDFEYLNQWKWCAVWDKKTNGYYAKRAAGNGKQIYMHRLLVNPTKGMVVDHRNHNTLDNQRVNLRVCTRKENAWNQRRPSNKAGYRGVISHKNRFVSQITVNYERKYLGSFATSLEAARVYDNAAKTYFGQFAITNFKDECIT